jgi:regulator of nonsense transcripts 1
MFGFTLLGRILVRAVIAQAHKYHEQGKSYRILTPYDAQRAMLEAELKASKLPWEDKVFCVDSFQGQLGRKLG